MTVTSKPLFAWRGPRAAGVLLLAACGALVLPVSAQELPHMTVNAQAARSAQAFEGTVEAVRKSVLAAQVPGAVLELNVKAGDRVRAGQTLVRIDARAAEQGAAASQAQVVAARAALEVAAAELARKRQLYERNYIAKAALEQAEAAKAGAVAQRDKADRGAREEEIRAAKSQWDRARHAAELAETTFGRLERLARDGVVPKQRRDEAEADIRQRVANKEVVIGFGHPVYTVSDPRNKVIKEVARQLSTEAGDLKIFGIAERPAVPRVRRDGAGGGGQGVPRRVEGRPPRRGRGLPPERRAGRGGPGRLPDRDAPRLGGRLGDVPGAGGPARAAEDGGDRPGPLPRPRRRGGPADGHVRRATGGLRDVAGDERAGGLRPEDVRGPGPPGEAAARPPPRDERRRHVAPLGSAPGVLRAARREAERLARRCSGEA